MSKLHDGRSTQADLFRSLSASNTNIPKRSEVPRTLQVISRLKSFADYEADGANYITLSTGDYYPDVLKDACALYTPVLERFKQILERSESSERLFRQINEVSSQWMRVQLARVFRKYVSPGIPVEMLKVKAREEKIVQDFGKTFRPIPQVQAAFRTRPIPDEALCALLWEYKDRGKKGYDLTERFFELFRSMFPEFEIHGPERAGKDVLMKEVFEEYPNPSRPVDFVILDEGKKPLVIGLARYDSDRGGAQEDDRPGQYRNAVDEILGFAHKNGLSLKIILLNDGPGLLLGTMWSDYVKLEESYKGEVLVLTLRMIPERLTTEWLISTER